MTTRRAGIGLALASVLALAIGFAAPVSAQTPPMRIRGEIAKVEGDMVTIHTRTGEMVTVKTTEKTAVTGVKKIEFSEVTKDKFVGIASHPEADGKLRALEVLVFPEAARGANEGHYPWDLEPNSMMTNANISAAVSGANGRELTLTPKGHDPVTIYVPEGVPVVTFGPAEKSEIKPGAKVMVIGIKQEDGSIMSPRILVGQGGIKPPM
jgi:hypothetical protein